MKMRYPGYIITIVAIVMLSACSGSKEMRTMKRDIRGTWVLQTIVTEGASGKLKDKIFNEADFSCFIGSEWKFSKEGLGSYTLLDKQKICPEIKRVFSWTYIPAGTTPASMSLKRLNDKNEPMESYTLLVTHVDKTTMKLKAEQMVEATPTAIIYNFVKQ